MNVIALYDIHGNVDALAAVLADPRASGAEAIVVGGDVVPGPFASDCLARLRAQEIPIHWVRGNGEREVAAAAAAGTEAASVPPDALAELTAAVTAAALGPEVSSWLGALPTTVTLDGVLYCHATPRRDDEMVTRLSPVKRWAEALKGSGASLVVGRPYPSTGRPARRGHTFRQRGQRRSALRGRPGRTMELGRRRGARTPPHRL